MYVIKTIEPDAEEVVHQDGAGSRVGVNKEGSGWICIVKAIAHRAKCNLRLAIAIFQVSSVFNRFQMLMSIIFHTITMMGAGGRQGLY